MLGALKGVWKRVKRCRRWGEGRSLQMRGGEEEKAITMVKFCDRGNWVTGNETSSVVL